MPSLRSRFLTHVRLFGVWRTIVYATYCLDDAYRFWRWGIGPAMRATRCYVSQEESGLPGSDYVAHQPTTSFRAFRTMTDRHVAPPPNDVFLDYGSGTGRALLMAANYPFRRVIGVEYSQPLVATAKQILRSTQHRLRCQDIQLINMDAAHFEVPPEVTVIYSYNPFTGPVLRCVCERIRASLRRNPRTLRILYFRPDAFKQIIVDAEWLIQRAEVRFPAYSADCFAVFQSIPPCLVRLPEAIGISNEAYRSEQG